MVWSKEFWKDATERALKTGAQFVLATLGVGLAAGTADGSTAAVINGLALDYVHLGGVFLGGVLISYLTSLASSLRGDPGTASLVTTTGKHSA